MLILVAVSVQILISSNLIGIAEESANKTKTAYGKESNLSELTIDKKEYNSIESYIEHTKGIETKSIVLTSSEQEIKFENTIKEYNISNEVKEYSTYQIEGISLTKDGEYITTGSITGKSGNLEIIGDINDTTFKYQLTSFMKGDEVFYCKVNIDGVEYFQELKIVQGDVVRYEQDYIKFTDSPVGADNIGQWFDIEGETWSGGTAKKLNSDPDRGTPSAVAKMEIEFQGSKCELIWGQEEAAVASTIWNLYDEVGEHINRNSKGLDLPELGSASWILCEDLASACNYSIVFEIRYISIFDYYKTGFSTIVIDAVEISR